MPGHETYYPLIFVSHSAKEVLARELLAKLYGALSQEYEVLLDKKRLHPTVEWRKELHTWMGLCHGAVVLLSEHALQQSPWVKKEATILGYRREMDEEFILVPVLIPPVTADMLTHGDFAPLELNAIQAAAGTTDEVVGQVLKSLKPLKDGADLGGPLWKLEKKVGQILSALPQGDRTALSAAAGKLGKRLLWQTDEKCAQQLARELLAVELEEAVRVLLFLADKIPGSGQKLAEVLSLLEPLWVDPEAVSELPRMNKRPRRQRAIRVNGVMCPFTGKSYIRRAHADRDWMFATISSQDGQEEMTPEAKVDQLIDEIQKQLVLGFEEGYTPSAKEIELVLNTAEQEEPIFIFVPKDFDEEVLGMLRESLQSFTFFMLGDDHAFDAPGLKDWQVLFLKPELSPGWDEKLFGLVTYKKGVLIRSK